MQHGSLDRQHHTLYLVHAGDTTKFLQHYVSGGLLLVLLLLPIWIGPYPPLYDYPAHLLEAQVTAGYGEAQRSYRASYEIRQGWQLGSNALATLVLLPLARVVPMPVAGQLLLSGYCVLFLTGLALWLGQAGAPRVLLLLAPVLAYNFTFTSGWLNFALAMALGLHALAAAYRWRAWGRRRDLVLLALLMLLIYSAHLFVWLLLQLVVMGLLAPGTGHRQMLGLLLALNSAQPLLVATQPLFSVGAVGGLIAWGGAALMVRPMGHRRTLLAALLLAGGLVFVVGRALWPGGGRLTSGLSYSLFAKVTFPLRTFTLPHQFMPPDLIIVSYNWLLAAALVAFVALLAWEMLRVEDERRPWFVVVIGLTALYLATPTGTDDIYFTEPRIVLLTALVALAGARLPHRPVLRSAVVGLVVAIGLTSTLMNSYYAWSFNQRARDWAASLAALPPDARVLQLSAATAPGYRMYPLGRLVNSYYSGDYFASMHVVTNGGFVSKAFYNGPARPRLDIDTFVYYLREFDDADYRVEECEATRGSYDVVVGWGPLEAALIAQLDACLGAGDHQGDLTFWKSR